MTKTCPACGLRRAALDGFCKSPRCKGLTTPRRAWSGVGGVQDGIPWRVGYDDGAAGYWYAVGIETTRPVFGSRAVAEERARAHIKSLVWGKS